MSKDLKVLLEMTQQVVEIKERQLATTEQKLELVKAADATEFSNPSQPNYQNSLDYLKLMRQSTIDTLELAMVGLIGEIKGALTQIADLEAELTKEETKDE